MLLLEVTESDCTLEQVYKQAKEGALAKVGNVCSKYLAGSKILSAKATAVLIDEKE